MAALRVLFLAHSFPRTHGDAAGSFLFHLAVALRDQDVEVQVVAPSAPGYPAFDTLDGIPVHRFRYAPQRWETLAYTGNMAAEVRGSIRGKLAMMGFILSGTGAAGRTLHGWGADLVHAHWWFPGGVTAMLPTWWYRVPLVTTLHGSDVRLASGPARPLMRAVLARSKAVTTVSGWLADMVRRVAPTVQPLVEPMPVDTGHFGPGPEGERNRLLFVGRLNAQKGIADLIEAMARTTATVHLDVIGHGTDRAALERRASDLGVAGRIAWHGELPQPSVAAFYQQSRAVVMPSVDEGLGLVAVEAQLCGTPVVAYASGGAFDTVADGVTGLLVSPRDIGGLAAALDRVVADPALAARMGRAGREQMLARFSPPTVAARYAGIYRRILGR